MFGNGNKYDPNKDIPDLEGKVYVVTGGSAGIGMSNMTPAADPSPIPAMVLVGRIVG